MEFSGLFCTKMLAERSHMLLPKSSHGDFSWAELFSSMGGHIIFLIIIKNHFHKQGAFSEDGSREFHIVSSLDNRSPGVPFLYSLRYEAPSYVGNDITFYNFTIV